MRSVLAIALTSLALSGCATGPVTPANFQSQVTGFLTGLEAANVTVQNDPKLSLSDKAKFSTTVAQLTAVLTPLTTAGTTTTKAQILLAVSEMQALLPSLNLNASEGIALDILIGEATAYANGLPA